MWSGRRFKLRKDLHAIEKMDDREVRTRIPDGEIVDVVRGPHENFIRIVVVKWLNREFVTFAVDLQACGDEILKDGG